MAAIPVNILPGATGESGVTAIGQLTVIPGTKNALQDLGDYLIFDKVRIYKRHANWGLDATVIPGPLQILTAVLGFKLGKFWAAFDQLDANLGQLGPTWAH